MDKSVRFRIELETNGQKVLANLSMRVEEFKDAIGEAVKETRTLDNSLKDLTEKSLLLSSMNTIIDQLSGAVGSLADEYNTFDKGMRAVNTMAGKDAGGLAVLKGQVEDLASAIPLTRKELADGLYQVISNGVPEDNWIDFLNKSARSAVGGIADIGQTVTVTSTVIKNYGLEWSAVGEIQDKIQMTARNGVTSFEQLAAALPRVTGNAATLGVTIDELMASFATLTGVSGNTAEVSTQLSAIFTALVKPSSEATEMARQMGIEFDAASIRAAGGMHNFLTKLNTDIQRYAAAHGMLEQEIYGKLFGSAEALRALIPITGELADTFSTNVEAMAGSAGTMDAAFEEMAGSGENVAVMLRNQLATMLDWVGGIASGIQPYMTFVAVSGQAIAGLVLMTSAARKAAVAIVALGRAHKSNAVVAALAAVHTKVVALAQRLLAASSATATAGTWALNVAVGALYATLTLGISAVITGLVTLFTSMGNEAENTADKVDVLKESTDAFSRAASDTKAELDMEIVSLSNLIKQQREEADKVQELNNRYGEALGHHKTAAEWYDTLVAKSKAYCTQIGYEAQARVLASQIAAKELERDEKQRRMQQLGQQYMSAGGKVQYGWQKEGVGENAYKATVSDVTRLSSEIQECQKQYDACIARMVSAQNELDAAVKTTTQSVTWQKMSYNDLGKAIEKQKTLVGTLAGTGAANAKSESDKLRQMEARYKKLGEAYGLVALNSNKNEFDGKKLIANAESYKALENNIAYYQTQLEKTSPSETAEIQRLAGLKKACEDARDAIKGMLDVAGRPTELNTLENIDKEIQYQQSLRRKATAESISGIDAEIQRLNELKTVLEESSHVSIGIDQIDTYSKLETELSFYEKKLKTVGESERLEIQKRIIELKKLREAWDETLSSLDVPEDISRLDTIDALDKALSYYGDKQHKASATEVGNIQRTIIALQNKRTALMRLTEIPDMQQELAQLAGLSGKELKMELELIGLEGVKDKIRSLQNMLADTKNPLDVSHRKEVQSLLATYEDYERILKKNRITFENTWSSVKGVGNGIQGLTEAIRGNGNAWETVVAVIDSAIQIYQGINSIIQIIDTLTAVTTASTAVTTASGVAATTSATAKTAAAPAEVAASAAVTAATKMQAMAYRELAASAFMAAHAAIPFVGFGIASGFIAAMEGLVASVAVTPFANGGLIYGPTLALMGEYGGASSNPEVVAPLDKLKSLIADGNGSGNMDGIVDFKIRGRRLEGVLARENKLHKRS